jgi:hypothetical protein
MPCFSGVGTVYKHYINCIDCGFCMGLLYSLRTIHTSSDFYLFICNCLCIMLHHGMVAYCRDFLVHSTAFSVLDDQS